MNAVKKSESLESITKELAVATDQINDLLSREHPAWPTGSVVVDILTGIGGLPKNRIVECFGVPSAGKSTLYWTTAAEVQKQGKMVVILDFERSFDPKWAKKLGMNVSDPKLLMWVRSEKIRTAEDGFNILYRLLDSELADHIGLIVWDSLASATTAAIADKKDVKDSARLMTKASLLADELPKLAEKLESGNKGITVGFVNQIRDNINAGPFGEQHITPGGKAFEHDASMRIHIKHRGYITDQSAINEFTGAKASEKVGQKLTISMAKTKHGQRHRSGEAIFMFQNGFDNIASLIEFATSRGDFKKISAQKFEVPAELTEDGQPLEGTIKTLKAYFHSNRDSYDKLYKFMVDAINKDYWEKVNKNNYVDDDMELIEPNMLDLEAGA